MCLHLHICVCVCVHVCLCVPAYAGVPLSFPPGLLSCFVLFRFPPLTYCRKQTLALCVLSQIFLPFQGIRWVGKCCAGMPGPLPEAGLLFLLIIEQKLLVFPLPWSQTSTQSSVLSSSCHLFFFVGPRGNRDCASVTLFLHTQPWLRETVSVDPVHRCSNLSLPVLMKALDKVAGVAQ